MVRPSTVRTRERPMAYLRPLLIQLVWLLCSGVRQSSGAEISNASYIDLIGVLGPFGPGEEVSYGFCINITSEDNISDLTLVVSSPRLKFDKNQSISDHIHWQLTVNSTDSTDGVMLNATFQENLTEDDYVITLYNISSHDATVSGNITMLLHGPIRLGEKLQSEISIFASTGGATSQYVDTVQSEAAYTLVPDFNMETNHPEFLHVGEYTKIHLTMGLPEGTIDPFVQAQMPYNDGPYVTVTGLNTGSKGSNLQKEHASETSAHFWNTEPWTRMDIAAIDSGHYDVIGGSPQNATNELEVEIGVRMEDRGLTNGSEVWVSGGVRFGDDLIWVALVPVYLEEKVDRVPKLAMTLSVHNQHTSGSKHFIWYNVHIDHVPDESSAYATNVTITWFSMPDVVLEGITYKYDIKSGGLHAEQDGDVITTWIDEVMFSDHASFRLKVSHLIGDWYPERFPLDYVVTAEPHYYLSTVDREEMFEHPDMTLTFDMAVTYSTPAPPTTCPCEYDPSLDCPCCGGATCQCGVMNPSKCAPCDSMWKCWKTVDGHERVVESDDGDRRFACSYEKNKKFDADVACFAQASAYGPWEDMSPLLGTIQGHTNTEWFATTNNGFGCVVSGDVINWFSSRCDLMDAAVADSSWVSSSEVVMGTSDSEMYYTRSALKTKEEQQLECEHQAVVVMNPSFEDDLSNWMPQLNVSLSNHSTHGNQSCRLGNGHSLVSQRIPVGPGYSGVIASVTCMVEEAPAAGADYGVWMTAENASGGALGSEFTPCQPGGTNGTWYDTSVSVQSGSDDIREVEVSLALVGVADGIVFFDDVQVWAVPSTDPAVCLV